MDEVSLAQRIRSKTKPKQTQRIIHMKDTDLIQLIIQDTDLKGIDNISGHRLRQTQQIIQRTHT